MSKAASSPTARLLQSSRLFSLPRPLPQPQLENITSNGLFRASDTATLPYPIQQAIATTPSSHSRGDWGLKRPLPSKATKGASTPVIRVSAQDTPEHITDFGSALDHTQTEAKWREMGVPVVYRQARDADRKTPPVSVFEESLDNTNAGGRGIGRGKGIDGQSGRGLQRPGEEKPRWKFAGPWIAGMQDGDFNLYTRQVEKRKPEWRDFVKSHVAEQRLADRRRQAQDEGEVLDPHQIDALRQELRPDDNEFLELEKSMRDNHAMEGLSSELTSLICDFFDLPAVRPAATTAEESPAQTRKLRGLLSNIMQDTDAIESAPPSTHPSAGLSYLRTNAVMENHPIHGPQAHRTPVLSRVVRPRNMSQGTDFQAKLGVGGIVAPDPVSASLNPNGPNRSLMSNNPMDYDPDINANHIDTELEGGNKMWVHPQAAYIDENGRIRLGVTRGDREAVAIKNGDVQSIHDARAAATRGMVGVPSSAAPGTAGNANYGYSLPDRRRAPAESAQMPSFAGSPQRTPDYSAGFRPGGERSDLGRRENSRRPEVRGFDEELGRQSGQGRMDDESAASHIRELLASRGRR